MSLLCPWWLAWLSGWVYQVGAGSTKQQSHSPRAVYTTSDVAAVYSIYCPQGCSRKVHALEHGSCRANGQVLHHTKQQSAFPCIEAPKADRSP